MMSRVQQRASRTASDYRQIESEISQLELRREKLYGELSALMDELVGQSLCLAGHAEWIIDDGELVDYERDIAGEFKVISFESGTDGEGFLTVETLEDVEEYGKFVLNLGSIRFDAGESAETLESIS